MTAMRIEFLIDKGIDVEGFRRACVFAGLGVFGYQCFAIEDLGLPDDPSALFTAAASSGKVLVTNRAVFKDPALFPHAGTRMSILPHDGEIRSYRRATLWLARVGGLHAKRWDGTKVVFGVQKGDIAVHTDDPSTRRLFTETYQQHVPHRPTLDMLAGLKHFERSGGTVGYDINKQAIRTGGVDYHLDEANRPANLLGGAVAFVPPATGEPLTLEDIGRAHDAACRT